MCYHTLFHFEEFPTSSATKWGLIWMSFHVRGKGATLSESFFTERTYIWSLTHMKSQMYRQIMFLFEGFPTGSAAMWGLIWMSFHVSRKGATLSECFFTKRANIRPLTRMNSQMYSPIIFTCEALSTRWTLVRGLLWMSVHIECKTNTLRHLY